MLSVADAERPDAQSRRVAYVHEWLTEWGGSEDVLVAMMNAVPADALHATIDFLKDSDRRKLGGTKVQTTFIQRLPFARTRFWNYLPLTPLAVESIDLSSADLIISSSHAFAKGALAKSNQLHISYVHSPMRYAWDLYHEYLRDYGLTHGVKSALVRWIFHRLRMWDRQCANNVDLFFANSRYVAQRIWRTYRRPAIVLHPPVRTTGRAFEAIKQDHYVTVSRLVSYKRVDLIIEAFRSMPRRKLFVIGSGPELDKLRRNCPPNVKMMGWQPDEVAQQYVASARAFIFAADEDFGISPVEAQASGTPVIAYRGGGAAETVRGVGASTSPTGMFFAHQTSQSLAEAVHAFDDLSKQVDPERCREWACGFSAEGFDARFRTLVDLAWSVWQADATQIESRMTADSRPPF